MNRALVPNSREEPRHQRIQPAMKPTTLLLCCLLALPFVGCRGTTEAERMPVSADTIGQMLGDAEKELAGCCSRRAGPWTWTS